MMEASPPVGQRTQWGRKSLDGKLLLQGLVFFIKTFPCVSLINLMSSTLIGVEIVTGDVL